MLNKNELEKEWALNYWNEFHHVNPCVINGNFIAVLNKNGECGVVFIDKDKENNIEIAYAYAYCKANNIEIPSFDIDSARIEDISDKVEFKLDYKSEETFKKVGCIKDEEFLIYSAAADEVLRIKKGTIVYF